NPPCSNMQASTSDLSLVISLVPEISPVLEVVEDLLLLAVDGGREGLDHAVDRDRGRAQRAELPDDVADGQAGAILRLAGDGQGGEHDGQVRLDRVAPALILPANPAPFNWWPRSSLPCSVAQCA